MAESLGLCQLISSNHVVVKQRKTVLEGNKYLILDPSGTVFLYAKEDAGMMAVLSGKDRAFNMQIWDNNKKQVITLRRPHTFGPDKMVVSLNGKVVSIVRQKPTMLTRVLYINDAEDKPVLRIKGPPGVSGDCEYQLQTADKKPIGVIHKKWRGFMKEMFSYADQYQIHFPLDLDVRFKAAVLGTCFLIDFLYHEN